MLSRGSVHLLLLSTLALGIACDSENTSSEQPDATACVGAKCDTPVGNDEACLARESEVLDSSQRGFTETDIRWACADVQGVNTKGKDDRGQEYCEYYAIVNLPEVDDNGDTTGKGTPTDLARNVNCSDGSGQVLRDQGQCEAIPGCEWSTKFKACIAPFVTIGGDPDVTGTTPPAVCHADDDGEECATHLSENQEFYLEDNPTEVIGACVFTSWHSDVKGPLDACPDGKCGDDAQIMGIPMTQDYMRMKGSINSNRAAADLVAECFALPELAEKNPSKGYLREGWEDDPNNPYQEPFFRGCSGANALFGTGWRRSDPSVCSVAKRLRECGCTADGLDEAIAKYKADNPTVQLAEFGRTAFDDLPAGAQAAIVLGDVVLPPQPGDGEEGEVTKRGFELATWDDRNGLPPGCRYAPGEDRLKSVVMCDIAASDLQGNLSDPKEFCRATYGNQVVVHVPLPSKALHCSQPDTPEGKTCGDMPWNIGAKDRSGA